DDFAARRHSEAGEREPAPQAIEDPGAVRDNARQSYTRRRRGHIAQRVVGNLRARIGNHYIGMLVRVAELDPKTLVLGVADRCNAPPGRGARNIAAGPGNIEVRPIKLADLTTHLAVAPGRLAIAQTDRPPLRVVGCE